VLIAPQSWPRRRRGVPAVPQVLSKPRQTTRAPVGMPIALGTRVPSPRVSHRPLLQAALLVPWNRDFLKNCGRPQLGEGRRNSAKRLGLFQGTFCFVRSRNFSSLILTAVVLLQRVAHAGKLDDVRDRTRYEAYSSDDDDDDDDDGDDGCGLLSLLLFGCSNDEREGIDVGGAQQAPPQRERRSVDLGRPWFYLAYPYASGQGGNLVRIDIPAHELGPADCERYPNTCEPAGPVAACIDGNCYRQRDASESTLPPVAKDLQTTRWQLFVDHGRDQDGLSRTGFGLYMGNAGLLGLDSGWVYWQEPLADGRTDGLLIGDLNLHLQFLTLPAVQWTVGVGPRFLTDGYGGSAGGNVTTRLEIYPVQPLILRAEADLGNLGPAFVVEGRVSAGVAIGPLELYGGFSTLRIADVVFDSWLGGLCFHL